MRWLFRLALILTATAVPMWPQKLAGIHGTVTIASADQIASLVPGIAVSLRCQKTQEHLLTAVTNEIGVFSFSDLPPDRCLLTIADPQFEEENETIDLLQGQVIERDFQLRIRKLEQKVVVTAESPRSVDTTTSSAAAPAITQSTLQSAPLVNDRFQDALPLTPGVVRGPDGLINIKGGRADQGSTLVNSVSATDPVTGKEAVSLPLEAVESVTVRPSPFSAEYGNFSSGVTEVETRSGGEKWKFLLTNFLPRPRRRDGSIMGIGAFTPRFTFAGPLAKDKLYLFQSFDYRFERTSVPSLPPLQHDQEFETFDASTQLDLNVSGRNHLSGNFLWYPQNVRYPLLNTFMPEATNPNFQRRGYLVSLNDRAIFGNALLESSFSVKRYDAHIFPASGELGNLVYYPEQNFGDWFNRQDRNSWLEQWAQTYRIGKLKAYGDHSLAIGYSFIHQDFDGEVTNQSVTVQREDHTTSQIINFSNSAQLKADGNQFSFFAQDHWMPWTKLSLDLGVRADHDSLSRDAINVAPRFGFVLAPTKSGKTALRGGIGLFYDKIPLDIATFLRYPAETVTQFAADGITPLGNPATFTHQMMAAALRQPYSLAWNLQLDRQLTQRVMVRIGCGERHAHHDFVLEPVEDVAGTANLQLWNTGSQSYRDFEATLRYQPTQRTRLFASYVHSKARGDLNTFEEYLGDFPNPIIRPDQYGPLPHDAPNRVVAWGSFVMPWKFELWPVLDVHTGFPYSRVDNDLNFVGRRNSERYPAFASLDLQILRPVRISMFGRKRDARLGLKMFNATGHFNPRDVQNNLFSPNYGRFYNGVGTKCGGKFEFDF